MNKTILKHREMGSLQQVADSLWKELYKEIERNGHSDLTLNIEGAAYSIKDIIDINNIEEVRQLKEIEE